METTTIPSDIDLGVLSDLARLFGLPAEYNPSDFARYELARDVTELMRVYQHHCYDKPFHNLRFGLLHLCGLSWAHAQTHFMVAHQTSSFYSDFEFFRADLYAELSEQLTCFYDATGLGAQASIAISPLEVITRILALTFLRDQLTKLTLADLGIRPSDTFDANSVIERIARLVAIGEVPQINTEAFGASLNTWTAIVRLTRPVTV